VGAQVMRMRKAGLSGLFLLCALVIVLGASNLVSAQRVTLEVADAVLAYDQRTSQPIITYRLAPASQKLFAEITARNVGRPMAFMVDGKVLMKPVIREPILGGSGQIVDPSWTVEQARDLAARIAAGKATIEIEVVND
jgi:preprotein translocase subunit SecD